MHEALGWFRSHERDISEWQLEVTRIPAPPFGEAARSAWLAERFRALALETHIDEVGNVLGARAGSDTEAPFIAFTAHLDTVFPAGMPLNVHRNGDKLCGPGVSDNACGIAALLGLAAALQHARLRTTRPLLFVGNVGEEGEGDLRGMRHIFSQARWRVGIAQTIVVDGASTETIVTEALGSRRYEITVSGPGGHSWSDFGTPNPIVLLARVIERISRLSLPLTPKTTLNIGAINGGTSVNSIPESASMRIDIRSSSSKEMDRAEAALRQALGTMVEEVRAETASAEPGITFEVRSIGNRPAAELRGDSRLLAAVRAVDNHLGIPSRETRASTDANIPLSLGCEALALGGGGQGAGAHTIHEWYDPRGRDLGLKRLLLVAAVLSEVE